MARKSSRGVRSCGNELGVFLDSVSEFLDRGLLATVMERRCAFMVLKWYSETLHVTSHSSKLDILRLVLKLMLNGHCQNRLLAVEDLQPAFGPPDPCEDTE